MMTEVDAQAARPTRVSLRRRLLMVVAAVALIGAIGAGLWYVLVGSRTAATDDAYVGGDVAQITPLIAAAVIDVRKSDTQAVRAGEPLVVLDAADAQVTADQAQAELQRAVRRVKGYFATDGSLQSQIAARDDDVTRARLALEQAQSSYDRAASELQHRQALVARAAVSGEELTTAQNTLVIARTNVASARASLDQANANRVAAQQTYDANHALTDGTSLDNNPEVASARAVRDQALLNLSRTVLRAPFAGVVARRQVQIGQRVAAGSALMTVVPVEHLYVDANFKEGQLRAIHVGQRVRLTSDTYGSGVVFHGTVVGRGAGTGSAFAIIPSQNATGNWIKVVQRVPVRIALDAGELRQHPLAIGASMNAEVALGN